MSPSLNPYAPPKSFDTSASALETAKGIWRDEKELIIVRDVLLPSRCVKCNVPAEPRSKPMTLRWHHSGFYLLFFVSPLIYIIAALIAQKRTKVSPALCDSHKKGRSNVLLIAWFGAIASLFLCVAVGDADRIGLVLLCFFVALGFAVFGIVKARIVYAKKIDDINVRMGGCGEAFLDSLPRFPG